MSDFSEEVRNYVPREGVDYLVDLYRIAGLQHDAQPNDIKSALRDRSLEYHPDRLAGLAPEFLARGERMALLINRAREVLLDEGARADYDDILNSWELPISEDGTPVLNLNSAVRAVMLRHEPKEIEVVFEAQYEQAVDLHKFNPKRLAMHQRMLETAVAEGGDEVVEIREALDEDLLAEEGALSISAEERGRLLGLAAVEFREPALGHADQVRDAIEGARSVIIEEHKTRVLGGVSTRLALLPGGYSSEGAVMQTDAEVVTSNGLLPAYYEDQVNRVVEIAERREEILAQRLDILEPTYPIADLQNEAQPGFMLGVVQPGAENLTTWLGFEFDSKSLELTSFYPEGDMMGLLTEGDFERVYAGGYNILTIPRKEHIEVMTLITEACRKYLFKFRPELREQLAKVYGW